MGPARRGMAGKSARSSDTQRGMEKGHEGTRVGGQDRRCSVLSSPAGQAPKRRLELLAPALTCAARGAAAIAGAPPPLPAAEEPAGKYAAYLEEGTDLILLQVGLDPGLLMRRHEELRRWGLELLFPGGGCSPSGCSQFTLRSPKAATAGAGGGAAEGRQPEVSGTELTQVTGGRERVAGCQSAA